MSLFAKKRKMTLGEFKEHLDRCISNLKDRIDESADLPPSVGGMTLLGLVERRQSYKQIRFELDDVE